MLLGCKNEDARRRHKMNYEITVASLTVYHFLLLSGSKICKQQHSELSVHTITKRAKCEEGKRSNL